MVYLYRFVQQHGGLIGFKGVRDPHLDQFRFHPSIVAASPSSPAPPPLILPSAAQDVDVYAVVDLRCNIDADARQGMPIEEQIRYAENKGDRRMLKKLKRRLALHESPDNPYANKDLLIQKVVEYLPHDRAISLAKLRNTLPDDVVKMLPLQMKKFLLSNSPMMWKVWEVGRPNLFYLSRPHLPPPRRALKNDPNQFTDLDCLRVVAIALRGGSCSIASINTRIPIAVDIALRTRLGGLDSLANRYPQLFALIIGDHDCNDLRHAHLQLLRMPTIADVPPPPGSESRGGDHSDGDISSSHKDSEEIDSDLNAIFAMSPEEATGLLEGADAEDQVLDCRGCGATFVFTALQARQFERRGHTHLPTRCLKCREEKRARVSGGGAVGSGSSVPVTTTTTSVSYTTPTGVGSGSMTTATMEQQAGGEHNNNTNTMMQKDQNITCRDCRATFVFSVAEQQQFKERGFHHQPNRCLTCRRLKRSTAG